MNIETLAADVAKFLNELEEKPIDSPVLHAKKMAEVKLETASYQTFVLPNAIADEPFNQGGDDAKETWTLSVVVSGPLAKKIREQGIDLASFYRYALRGTNFSGWQFAGTSIESLFDEDAEDADLFAHLFRVNFWKIT